MEIKDDSNPRKSTNNRHCERYNTKAYNHPRINRIEKKDLDACMELVMHLTNEQIDFVKDLETSKEIWDALKECHEPSDKTTKINTLRHLVTL